MNQEVKKILDRGKPTEIKALFAFTRQTNSELIRKKFLYWSRYFFPRFFGSKDAPFHADIDRRNLYVYMGSEHAYLDIAFRGSAKTTRTKLFVAFCIANDEEHFRKYIKVLSKDIGNAKQISTDVYNLLIAPRVKAMYPEIFAKTATKREETMASFTTATGVKMIADTVGTDQRGQIQDEARPDFVWYEDFETRLSLASAVTTDRIWDNMEEARTGLAKDGGSIYTCNYISERGNVHKLVEKIKLQTIVPIEQEGKPTWPERYTMDDIKLLKDEADDYVGEYLCQPSASKDVYFDRESVDKQTVKESIDEIAGLKIFRKFDASGRLGSGHDVGGGVGLDHSTSVFIEFDCFPAEVIATFKDNEIKPDSFAYEIVRQCKRFGENYCAVENNYGSTIDILKTIYPTDKLHKTKKAPAIVLKAPTEYGWKTNTVTKNTMMSALATAVEKGHINLNDAGLIAEMKSYTRGDLMDKEVDPRLTTRHFDLLVACAIAWQTNVNIKKPEAPDPFALNPELAHAMSGRREAVNPAV
ncbi:hypothetical protein CMI37_10510 [Candidatus Pacearchaeota archaeon]|jgi:hypothetical protein|nr:hypothetical protein [Candidatus Pacearchaeota archaeon]